MWKGSFAGGHEGALTLFERAQKLKPEEAHILSGLVYYKIGKHEDDTKLKQEHFDKAYGHFTRVTQIGHMRFLHQTRCLEMEVPSSKLLHSILKDKN